MIHYRAPLLEGLTNYVSLNKIPFHMPGHKQGKGTDQAFARVAGSLLSLDLTEVPGLDNLHAPGGVIRQAQELAAQAFKADQTFFLVNGTTCGLQALILALCRPGDSLIMPRHVHISALEGIILSGARPVFIEPRHHPKGFSLPPTPEELDQALKGCPEAKGVLLVSPTYYGITPDLKALVKLVHHHDKLVIIDEAHGAHLAFHQELPLGAMEAGADACVQSTHKMLGSLTQSSMLHLQGSRIDPEGVRSAVSLVQSTSPSYLLMASLDGARRQMALGGNEILSEVIKLAGEARQELNNIRGLHVVAVEDLGRDYGLDPLKLLIRVSGLGITGFKAHKILSENYGLQLEMADNNHVLAMYSVGTTKEDNLGLIKAFEKLASNPTPGGLITPVKTLRQIPRLALLPREGWFTPVQERFLEECEGKIAARAVVTYPPGSPVLWPGEVITREIIEYLSILIEKGLLGEPGKPYKIAVAARYGGED